MIPIKSMSTFVMKSLHYNGFSTTLVRFLVPFLPKKMFPKLRNSVAYNIGKRFDERWSVDTDGLVYVEDLGIDASLQDSAFRYSASSAPLVSTLLESYSEPFDDYTFIDLGSGKGRTLLVASDFAFEAVIGVELSTDLHEIAASNILQYKKGRQQRGTVESVNINAAKFKFPASNTVLYMFNPFPDNVLREVCRNMIKAVSDTQSTVIVYYANPTGKKVFEDAPEFREFELPALFKSNWRAYKSTAKIRASVKAKVLQNCLVT